MLQQSVRPRPSVFRVDPQRRPPSLTARATAKSPSYTAPSNAPGKSQLQELNSIVVSDTLIGDDNGVEGSNSAALVASSVVKGILRAPAGLEQYQNAIEKAISYDKCYLTKDTSLRNACQWDKAITNLGCMMGERVDGVISTEVDPRTYADADAMVERGQQLVTMYKDSGMDADRVVIRLPCSWTGVQACKQLSQDGTKVHLTGVFSVMQAAAAGAAGAALLQVHVGQINDWFDRHPGVIRDPAGPREDAASRGPADVGDRLVARIDAYVKQEHPDVKVMAVGLRNAAAAQALSGVDYLVLSPKIIAALAAAPTLAGYNDGLHAMEGSKDTSLEMALRGEAAGLVAFKPGETSLPESEAAFNKALGMAGQELLVADVLADQRDLEAAMSMFDRMVYGRE